MSILYLTDECYFYALQDCDLNIAGQFRVKTTLRQVFVKQSLLTSYYSSLKGFCALATYLSIAGRQANILWFLVGFPVKIIGHGLDSLFPHIRA